MGWPAPVRPRTSGSGHPAPATVTPAPGPGLGALSPGNKGLASLAPGNPPLTSEPGGAHIQISPSLAPGSGNGVIALVTPDGP